jgi:son of sevenless-like protein
MLELVREVVEMVCRLLTIVDGVMKHPGIPAPKILNLKAAKHGLYNVTSSLAESVRVLTSGANGEEGSEEDERAGLLKLATDASKAGSDCVSEVKKCLLLSVVDEPILLQLPVPEKLAPGAFSASKQSEFLNKESQGVAQLTLEIDEDTTVQGDLLPLVSPQQPFADDEVANANEGAALPPEVPPDGRDSACSTRSARVHKAPPSPLVFTSDPVAPTLPSPVSFARTDDDGTTWEGSHNLHGRSSHDTTRSGRTTPRYARSELDGRLLLSHDYSLEDVAYNKGRCLGRRIPRVPCREDDTP